MPDSPSPPNPARVPRFGFSLGLRPGVVLTALFGLTLVLVVWTYVLHLIASEHDDEIRRSNVENSTLACAFEEHVRHVIKSADNALLFLKRQYEEHDRVTESMLSFVKMARNDPIINQLSIANASGDVILNAIPTGRFVNISTRRQFQLLSQNSSIGLDIGRPIITASSHTWSFFLGRRLNKADGSFGGIVAIGLDPKYFSDYYKVSELGTDRGILLIGKDGIVRARRFLQNSTPGQDMSASTIFRDLRSSPHGNREVVSLIDRRIRLSSYRALPDYPLIVTVASLKTTALASFERRKISYYIAASTLTLFIVGFCASLVHLDRRSHLQYLRLQEELLERRKAEHALTKSQSMFAEFMDHVPATVFLKDLQGETLYTNEAFRMLFGKDAVVPTMGDEERTLREGSIVIEEQVTGRDGRLRTFETRKFVVGRADKAPLLGGIAVDISERKQAEEERLALQHKMQAAQKMESLGILAGGIAHDFNNLLMGILGNVEMALVKAAPESAVRPFLQRADTAVQRAADLARQMLAYSGKGRFVVGPVDLSALVEEMLPLLAAAISKGATVRHRLDAHLPAVDADATQLRQVVMNLITNASDALGDKDGVITVSTGTVQADSSYLASNYLGDSLPEGRYAYVEVSDTGCGMDAATRAKIFDPFFSTKHPGRGLGLAATLGIVRGHGGAIKLSTDVGRGTTFTVLIPAAERAETPEKSGPAAAGLEGKGQGMVLVADDEEAVRSVTKEILEDGGYSVLTVADGAEAVEVFQARAGEVAAVVLDMTMPRMGGVEAFRLIRRLDPAVPVILASGYSQEDSARQVADEGLSGFVQKPYRAAALLETIRTAIGAAPRGES